MWKPWQWPRTSNTGALDNARCAATDLSRARVERDDVEIYLRSALGERPVSSGAVRPA